jgi:hypothetical protein
MFTRRSLLAVPIAAAPVALGAPQPSGTARETAREMARETPVLEPLSSGRVILRRHGQGDGLILPAGRARIVGRMMLAGHHLTATAFAADPDADTAIDLFALTTLPPGAPPRLLGLEVLTYADGDGTRIATTMAATSDEARIVLSRAGSTTRGPTLINRSAWRDYLAWTSELSPLEDAPIHPPPEHSLPAALATRRTRVRVALTGDIAEITPALLRDTYLLRKLAP